MWTPFEAATALKAVLEKEGYAIVPKEIAMLWKLATSPAANRKNEK
jgi:hypothetical protein